MTFAGEELGLLGSAYYVAHPELPLEKAVAMINMDMIGRVRDGKLYIGGSASGSNFRAHARRDHAAVSDLNVDYSGRTGDGSSDHTSFTSASVPVLFFFSGLHADYHKPSDTWDKIDAPDAAKAAGTWWPRSTDDLRDTAERPQFVRVAPPARTEKARPGR